MNFLIYLSEEVENQKKLCYNKLTEVLERNLRR